MEQVKCGIVQDLLPSYHDGLTAEETTEMIREHLVGCLECRNCYENLEQSLRQIDTQEISKGRHFQEKLMNYRYYGIGFLVGLCIPVGLIILFIGQRMIINFFLEKLI